MRLRRSRAGDPREKHERMQEFARALPRMREITTEHLATIGHFEKAVARMVTSRHGGSR